MKIDDNLSGIFDVPKLTTTEVITSDGEIVKLDDPSSPPDDRIETDYERSRNNLHDLIHKGQEALMHALEVAKQSEHPRAFEVVGNLVKQLADVNQQLMDLHQQKQKLDIPAKSESGGGKQVTNNNAIFVGSTAELNKLIKNMTKGE